MPSKSFSESTVKISYQYQVFGDPQKYRSEFKFDMLKPQKPRTTWLHKDSINRETYTQPI
jgi:hypothetical protein